MSSTLVQLLTDQGKSEEDALYELCNTISNIVSSYDDHYDAFAELVQNALDAVAARYEKEAAVDFVPKITVEVDTASRTLTVTDNGTGISWDQHKWAVKPNYSLKRRLGQKNSRGEKGAALAFLQFGHGKFELTTQTESDSWKYSLTDGREWFKSTYEILEDERPYPEKEVEFPKANYTLEQTERDQQETSGTTAMVCFHDDRLDALLGDDAEAARTRLEYILLTRTGVGFYIHDGDVDTLPAWQQKLKVTATLKTESTTKTWPITPGFLFPHIMAKRAGSRKSSLLTASKPNSELLYDYFDEAWVKKYLEKTGKVAAHLDTIRRFQLRGYVSYSYHNSWYEEVSAKHLTISGDVDNSAIAEGIIQINGGFLVSVRDFPTGRRKSFLHRSGAEHKSRTFVLLNFAGDYKPDYGRKNLGAEAHAMVLDLCKDLISFASNKRDSLYRGTQQSAHNAKNTFDAEESLKEDAKKMVARGYLIKSGDDNLTRAPATETEVVAEFIRLVSRDALPGFAVYGFLARGILDGYFDYELPADGKYAHDSDSNPLGVAFAEGKPFKIAGRWMEFKVRSDGLIDDLNKKPGESGKKYFGLIDLLICESIDTATDGYELAEISEDNYDERRFYGVTHLLESSGNNEHKIQVICLRRFREILADTGQDLTLPEVGPLEV